MRAALLRSERARHNGPMNLVMRALQNSAIGLTRAYQRLFMDLHVWGREHISPGPSIYVINHITAFDFLVAALLPDPVHIVVGPGYKSPWAARILDALEHINAMPAHRGSVVSKAVGYLRSGESVLIAPEGDMQEPFRLGRFYPGVARMYRETRVPLVPIGILAPKRRLRELPITTNVDGHIYRCVIVRRGPLCISIGRPLTPELPDGSEEEQERFVLDLLRETLEGLIEDARVHRFWQ